MRDSTGHTQRDAQTLRHRKLTTDGKNQTTEHSAVYNADSLCFRTIHKHSHKPQRRTIGRQHGRPLPCTLKHTQTHTHTITQAQHRYHTSLQQAQRRRRNALKHTRKFTPKNTRKRPKNSMRKAWPHLSPKTKGTGCVYLPKSIKLRSIKYLPALGISVLFLATPTCRCGCVLCVPPQR